MNDTDLRETQTLYGHMSVMRNRWKQLGIRKDIQTGDTGGKGHETSSPQCKQYVLSGSSRKVGIIFTAFMPTLLKSAIVDKNILKRKCFLFILSIPNIYLEERPKYY